MCWWKEIGTLSHLTENQELFLLKFFFPKRSLVSFVLLLICKLDVTWHLSTH